MQVAITIIVGVILFAAAVLVAILLHLTPRQFKGETRWSRLRRSMTDKHSARR